VSAPAEWVGLVALETDPETGCAFWSRGYATDEDGTVFLDIAIGRHLARRRHCIPEVVKRLNGCFSAVLSDPEQVTVVTDRFGTVPVYIARECVRRPAVSDDAWSVVANLRQRPRLSEAASIDLLHCGYVTGQRTLLEGVETAAPASITRIHAKGQQLQRYWNYGYAPEPIAEQDLVGALERVLRTAAIRSHRVIAERRGRPLLTLSGGLDSRLLAALLATTDASRPSALSYGSADDAEVSAAAEVAAALGIAHRVIPVGPNYMCEDFLKRSIREVGFTTRFTCGTGARHIGALSGEVFVPGHTGDFVSGGHLPPQVALVRTADHLNRFLDQRHYRYPSSERILRRLLTVDPDLRFANLTETTAAFDFQEDMFGLIDRWNVENRQRRLILMELRAYEASGQWVLPFYDYEIVDFFSRIPHRFRMGQSLYIRTALERIFTGAAAPLATVRRVGGTLRVNEERNRQVQVLASLPDVLCWPLLAAIPLLQNTRSRLRSMPTRRSGPDPIRYWYYSNPPVHNFIESQLNSNNCNLVDTDAVFDLAAQRWIPEEFFNRFIPALISLNATLREAEQHWEKHSQDQPHALRSLGTSGV
jgi:asparagine synthase (glutamine-hydrolysing)